MNKIAFLCVNPWERFLPFSFQSCVREYYQSVKARALSLEREIGYREYVEVYGETIPIPEVSLFLPEKEKLQLLYIQSSRIHILERLFKEADLVVMGLSGSRKETEKFYLSVHPWHEKVLFLWDSHICQDETFAERLVREFKLRNAQVMEIKKGM